MELLGCGRVAEESSSFLQHSVRKRDFEKIVHERKEEEDCEFVINTKFAKAMERRVRERLLDRMPFLYSTSPLSK